MVLRTRQDVPTSALEPGGVLGTGHQLPGGTLDLPADGTVSLRTVNYYDDYSFHRLAGFGGLGAFDDNGRLGDRREGAAHRRTVRHRRPDNEALLRRALLRRGGKDRGDAKDQPHRDGRGHRADVLLHHGETARKGAHALDREPGHDNRTELLRLRRASTDPPNTAHKVRPDELVLAANTYDELGRLAKTVKPAETVTLRLRPCRGRVTDIDGKFSQSLQYDYVGNIKAMRVEQERIPQGYSLRDVRTTPTTRSTG